MFEDKTLEEQLDNVLSLLVGKGDEYKHYITYINNISLPDDSMLFINDEYVGILEWEPNPKVETLEQSLDDMDPTQFICQKKLLKEIIFEHLKTLKDPETCLQKIWFSLT